MWSVEIKCDKMKIIFECTKFCYTNIECLKMSTVCHKPYLKMNFMWDTWQLWLVKCFLIKSVESFKFSWKFNNNGCVVEDKQKYEIWSNDHSLLCNVTRAALETWLVTARVILLNGQQRQRHSDASMKTHLIEILSIVSSHLSDVTDKPDKPNKFSLRRNNFENLTTFSTFQF